MSITVKVLIINPYSDLDCTSHMQSYNRIKVLIIRQYRGSDSLQVKIFSGGENASSAASWTGDGPTPTVKNRHVKEGSMVVRPYCSGHSWGCPSMPHSNTFTDRYTWEISTPRSPSAPSYASAKISIGCRVVTPVPWVICQRQVSLSHSARSLSAARTNANSS